MEHKEKPYMPQYNYKALDSTGKEIKGEMLASSKEALQQILQQRGLLLQRAETSHTGLRQLWVKKKPVNAESFLLLNQEIIALLKAGLPIPQIFEMVSARPNNITLQQVLKNILADITSGDTLSAACSKHPHVFDKLYISSLRVGELSGELAPILERYIGYLKLKMALKQQFSKAMVYPVFLTFMLLATLALLFIFVIPRFVDVYADFGAKLPAPTQLLLDIAENMPVILPVTVIGMLGIMVIYRSLYRSTSGRLAIDHRKLALPFFGRFIYTYTAIQTSRMLATLLGSGMTLINALEVTQESIENQAFVTRLKNATQAVNNGKSLADSFEKEAILPDTAIKMIQAGEQSGSLDHMLAEIASFEEERLKHQLSKLTSLIEPAVILLLGLLVGAIIVAMYLPIFNITTIVE